MLIRNWFSSQMTGLAECRVQRVTKRLYRYHVEWPQATLSPSHMYLHTFDLRDISLSFIQSSSVQFVGDPSPGDLTLPLVIRVTFVWVRGAVRELWGIETKQNKAKWTLFGKAFCPRRFWPKHKETLIKCRLAWVTDNTARLGHVLGQYTLGEWYPQRDRDGGRERKT